MGRILKISRSLGVENGAIIEAELILHNKYYAMRLNYKLDVLHLVWA